MTNRALPSYTHIPGVTPHPLRDPAGHSYREPKSLGQILKHPPSDVDLTWENLPSQSEFQWAVKLFNAGYYWESHEAWESLWHLAGRTGWLADYLKALIKLAAAGVKLREHNASGVERHARRASELFQSVSNELVSSSERSCPLLLTKLIVLSDHLIEQPPPFPEDRTGRPVAVFPQLPAEVISFSES